MGETINEAAWKKCKKNALSKLPILVWITGLNRILDIGN